MTVTCTNTNCPEHGVPKDATGLEAEAAAGEITCGTCGQPCDADDA